MSERDPYEIGGMYVSPRPRVRPDRRVTDHVCGYCRFDHTGRADCPNRFEDPDAARDEFLVRVDDAREAEMDRQMGVSEW